jgi:superfamily I DNA/RNA helicase
VKLTKEQQVAVDFRGNVLVTACPGSGKTRVLTHRVARGLQELTSTKHRVIAMTFTNRATDELQRRLDRLAMDIRQLWAGTIHSFALEWILRPYAPYDHELRLGFSIADEFVTERLLHTLRSEFDAPPLLEINTNWNRRGQLDNGDQLATDLALEYKRRLREAKLIDYDDVLYYAYRLLTERPEIAQTLSYIQRLLCVDEIQDTQDLQYGIFSAIFRATNDPPTLFFVGDLDQSIYESLGSLPKTVEEIADEFGLPYLENLNLTGNYRSTQRLIDFYQHLRPNNPRIESLADWRQQHGHITFHNHSVDVGDLAHVIAGLIEEAKASHVPAEEICVLAPQWWHVRAIGRTLVRLLPDVKFDAPGLSPFQAQRDNIWFKLARMFLTTPSPPLFVTRVRWAGELLRELRAHRIALPDGISGPRQFLRYINSIVPKQRDGLSFLKEAFTAFINGLRIDLKAHKSLAESEESFLVKASERVEDLGNEAPTDIDSFRRLFEHPAGVVIGTCHAVKGEEYDTVIAFGLLEGYIPNWRVIINDTDWMAREQSSKLLYVIASRAKRTLHLIAEAGRFTKSQREYQPSKPLAEIEFNYD